MSSLVVEVVSIEDIRPHHNADKLEIAIIKGWQVVTRKGEYNKGDKAVYFPLDTLLPLEWSEKFGVTNFLSNGRVRCAKLRGEPSFGLAVPPEKDWTVGTNVAEYYGATKYEPPLRATAGDAEIPHPLFVPYTEIENMRTFPAILQEGEPVVVSEKIHGTNSRVGCIEGQLTAGSMGLRRKMPEDREAWKSNLYWFPLTITGVQELLKDLGHDHQQVILYGEVYGSKVQNLNYGLQNKLGYRAFDILVDGKYLDFEVFQGICNIYQVETVPILDTIPFSLSTIKTLSEGTTTLVERDAHIREGVVVKPLKERTDSKTGRVILKYINDAYLFAKESGKATDTTDK